MQRNFWIFDMDGTLTVSVHDFAAISAELGLPADRPILEAMEELPASERAPLEQRLAAIEHELATRATAQQGAQTVLETLAAMGAMLGILTRNSHANAIRTLESAGLGDFFEPRHVLGREACAPKPSADGVHKLMNAWKALPRHGVMVGDYLFDMIAGRTAGLETVYFDPSGGFEWSQHADHCVSELDAILSLPIVADTAR